MEVEEESYFVSPRLSAASRGAVAVSRRGRQNNLAIVSGVVDRDEAVALHRTLPHPASAYGGGVRPSERTHLRAADFINGLQPAPAANAAGGYRFSGPVTRHLDKLHVGGRDRAHATTRWLGRWMASAPNLSAAVTKGMTAPHLDLVITTTTPEEN
jgi:hypothetical protein